MSMSERTEVLIEHRTLAMMGDAKHIALAATLADVKRAGRRKGACHCIIIQAEYLMQREVAEAEASSKQRDGVEWWRQ